MLLRYRLLRRHHLLLRLVQPEPLLLPDQLFPIPLLRSHLYLRLDRLLHGHLAHRRPLPRPPFSCSCLHLSSCLHRSQFFPNFNPLTHRHSGGVIGRLYWPLRHSCQSLLLLMLLPGRHRPRRELLRRLFTLLRRQPLDCLGPLLQLLRRHLRGFRLRLRHSTRRVYVRFAIHVLVPRHFMLGFGLSGS